MGLGLKALALLLGLVLALFGAWLFAIPLFVYVFWGVISRRRKKPTQVQVSVRYPDRRSPGLPEAATAIPQLPTSEPYQEPSAVASPQRSRFPIRYVAGGVLVLLSLVAMGQGGVYSPVVIGALGLTLIFWGRISSSAQLSTFSPVRESVLMKLGSLPFVWLALAEVKFATRSVAAALASIDQRILITTYEKPGVYVLFHGVELTHSRAEAKLFEKMREVEATVAPLGVYLLPVDGKQAVDSLGFSTKAVKVDPKALSHSLFTLPHEILSIRPKDGYVDSVGVFVRKEDRREAGKVIAPAPSVKPARPPLLWETLRLVERKLKWPAADAQTAFLSSLYATRDETLGERIIEAADPPSSQVLVVKSLGSPQVELTRPQLRALVQVYASAIP